MSGNWAASVTKRRVETADSSCICRTRCQRATSNTVDVVIPRKGREYFPDAVREEMLEVTEGRMDLW